MFQISQVALNWLNINSINIEAFLASRVKSYEHHGKSTYYQRNGYRVSFFWCYRHITMEIDSDTFYYAEDRDVSYFTLNNQFISNIMLAAISTTRPIINKLIELPDSLEFFQGAKIIYAEQINHDLRFHIENNWKVFRTKHPKRVNMITTEQIFQIF